MPPAPKPPMADYRPPRATFVPCPGCRAPLLPDSAGALVNPCFGSPHTCPRVAPSLPERTPDAVP